MSAALTIDSEHACTVKIREGKYHQIKRMFRANGLQVEYLKRTAIGGLALDETLAQGACRELDESEVERISMQHLE